MFSIFTFVICYLIAAISPSIIISKRVLKQDIRELGSGNAGTTNSIRTMGKGIGALVFVLDLIKVVLSYLVVIFLAWIFKKEITPAIKTLYMLASVIGHSYPVYYGFKGGKGVAVFLMSAIMIDFKLALICIAFGVAIILISRYVSLGSMLGAILLVVTCIFKGDNFNIFLLLITVLIIIYNHRENIIRLKEHRENKLF